MREPPPLWRWLWRGGRERRRYLPLVHLGRMKPVTSYPAHGVDNGAENQLTAFVDRAGYVVGGKVTREKGAGVMKRPDFPAPEIVIAPGDEWGRTVLETRGKQYVIHEQTAIARDVERAAAEIAA
jgi:hypothetical protein